ncbi:LOW QUALITY PROTEIN: p450 domain-containing protein, partial [Cephalotus follicularis]
MRTSKSTPSFLHFVEKLSISMMVSWKQHKEITFFKDIKGFTLKVMVKHLLSIEPEEPLALKILQDFETFMRGFVSLPIYIPGTAYVNAVKDVGFTRGDFLDVILSKRSLNDEEIVCIVSDIMLGGYETTATLLALLIYFLGHAPNVFQKLKEEHEAIRKRKEDGELMNWEDYEMEFTSKVIYESMRCGIVVKFVHRRALKDVQYKGYFIPAGWKVLPVCTGVHLDPSRHENRTEFNPCRWTDKASYKKVMPFGGGPLLCPGPGLAKVEISFFLHHLVLNY